MFLVIVLEVMVQEALPFHFPLASVQAVRVHLTADFGAVYSSVNMIVPPWSSVSPIQCEGDAVFMFPIS